jgi:hypothetical protein
VDGCLNLTGTEIYINSPDNNKFCHYLPDSYDVIRNYTPNTIWFKKDQISKSLEEACFIPDASDSIKVKRVVNRFLELQGDDLNEVAKKINCRFFTMDIAKVENGSWVIIELGDGQVSGLPDNADLYEFYYRLKTRLI